MIANTMPERSRTIKQKTAGIDDPLKTKAEARLGGETSTY